MQKVTLPGLLDEWRDILLKSWSIRITALMAGAAGALGSHEMIAIGLLSFLPPGKAQTIGAAVVGLVVFGFPAILARLAKQPKLQAKIDANAQTNTKTN